MKLDDQKDSAAASPEEKDDAFQKPYNIFEEDNDEFYEKLLEEDSAAGEDYFEVPQDNKDFKQQKIEEPEPEDILALIPDTDIGGTEEQFTEGKVPEARQAAYDLPPEEVLEEAEPFEGGNEQQDKRESMEELPEDMGIRTDERENQTLDMGNDEMPDEDIQKLLGEVFSEEAGSDSEENPQEDIFSINDFMGEEESEEETDGKESPASDAEFSGEMDPDLLQLIPDAVSDGEEEEQPKKKGKKSKKKKEKKEKKPNLFARIFGNIKEERTEEEVQQMKEKVYAEAEAKEKAEIQKQEREAALRAAKEAKKKKAAEDKKANAAKAKKEKAEQAKAKKEAKAAKKEAKIKKQQEIQSLIDEIEENEGKINKIGAGIIFVLFIALAVYIVVGTNQYSYKKSIETAERQFEFQHYNEAYDAVAGVKVKKQDQELYDKVMTVMYVNKEMNSYRNYYNLGLYPEALDSLMKGLKRYELYISIAGSYGIEEDLDYVRSQILTELDNVFHISEKEAYNLLSLNSQPDYSGEIYAFVEERFVPPVKEETLPETTENTEPE